MDHDDDIERVTEIHGVNFIKKNDLPNRNLCYLKVEAKLFSRLIYREPNHPDVLVEQTIHGGRREILNRGLPQRARNSRAELREEILLNEPDLGNPGNVLMSGRTMVFSANDINWNSVAQTLSKYAKHSGAFPERGRREVFGVRGDIAFGEVKVMTLENGWDQRYWQEPAGNVNDTLCICCQGSYDFQDPNHIHQVVELPCRHLFHKTCIYKWIWTNQVYNSNDNNSYCFCPTCDAFIC
ncbi:hypothetical protein N665_0014s0144 [Sinapis alba]|nr:hypothetical protein N665_0014s0144 [Sinapis alba]